MFKIQKSPIKSGIKTSSQISIFQPLQFKKAPSNRGLRPILLLLLIKVVAIQKSPIKSGIKTSSQISIFQPLQFKKAPSNRGLRPYRQTSLLAGFAIQKSPIKSGIKTADDLVDVHFFLQFKKAPSNRGLRRLCCWPPNGRLCNSKKPHQIGD